MSTLKLSGMKLFSVFFMLVITLPVAIAENLTEQLTLRLNSYTARGDLPTEPATISIPSILTTKSGGDEELTLRAEGLLYKSAYKFTLGDEKEFSTFDKLDSYVRKKCDDSLELTSRSFAGEFGSRFQFDVLVPTLPIAVPTEIIHVAYSLYNELTGESSSKSYQISCD